MLSRVAADATACVRVDRSQKPLLSEWLVDGEEMDRCQPCLLLQRKKTNGEVTRRVKPLDVLCSHRAGHDIFGKLRSDNL
jgi:hypothetical protein